MKFHFTIILLNSWIGVMGQNLVPNPGFEKFIKCPEEFTKAGEIFMLPGWYSPNLGTPDYFNECSEEECNANANWAGISREHSGMGYAGIISFMTSKDYREYLAAELLKPLDSGVIYSLQFSFRLSSYSLVSSGNLGMAFSEHRVDARHDKILSPVPALIAMRDSAMVLKTGNWQTVNGKYVADGKEKHLIIGNFFPGDKNPVYKIKFGGDNEPMLRTASYFYIDDVMVRPMQESLPVIPVVSVSVNPFEADSLITLKLVQFPYNSATINKGSEAELDRLIKFLRTNPSAKVEILGHTDDQGTDEYNKQLSLRRAKAVMEYVAGGGVGQDRMAAFGYGKTKPLVKATDENARGINRRVEVRLVR